MTELEHKAYETWVAIHRKGMPIFAALDCVQDVAGERDMALRAVIEAASKWLMANVPGKKPKVQYKTAELVAGLVLIGDFDTSDEKRREETLWLCQNRGLGNLQLWLDWLHDCRRVIRLCRELTEQVASERAAQNPSSLT